MAAENVTALTDAQLRKSLQSYGQNVGPITKTTRKLLEKKLQKLIDNPTDDETAKTTAKKTPKSPGRRSSVGRRAAASPARKSAKSGKEKKFAPFSSDEEEIDSSPQPAMKSMNTSPIGFPTPPPNEELSVRRKAVRNATEQKVSNLRSRKSIVNQVNDDHFEIPALDSSLITSSSPAVATASASTSLRNRKTEATTYRSEFSDDDFPLASMTNTHASKRRSMPLNGRTTTTKHAEQLMYTTDLTNVNNRSSTPNRRRSAPLVAQQPVGVDTDLDDSKIRDEIDASLVQIRNSFSAKKPSPLTKKGLHNVETRTERKPYYELNAENEEENEEEEDDEDEELDAEFISSKKIAWENIRFFVMISVFVMFLLLGIGLYFYSDEDVIRKISNDGKDDSESKQVDLINHWYRYLSQQTGLHECGYNVEIPVTEGGMKKSATAYLGPGKKQIIQESLKSLKKKEGEYDEYITYESGKFSSTASSKPFTCRVTQAITVILQRILIVIILVVLGLAGYYIMKTRWTKDDEETRQMLYFVDKIIDTLRRHHVVCMSNKDIPPYLPIPHVRDMLIPLAKRKKMAKIWQKAVQFLNSSDSRIRVETKQIAGEDFEVWRWIGICTPKVKKKEHNTRNDYLSDDTQKCWQGPAFDEIEKVVRMPIVTPTPCLKIRYMHEGPDEKGHGWENRVRDAVLEKCINDGAQLLHLFVDASSKEGCVYVKCDSLDSAGKAFRSMYGNWFDGRLIIVKFVTLARYHQRFPDALKVSVALKPSASAKSSLNWIKEDND